MYTIFGQALQQAMCLPVELCMSVWIWQPVYLQRFRDKTEYRQTLVSKYTIHWIRGDRLYFETNKYFKPVIDLQHFHGYICIDKYDRFI